MFVLHALSLWALVSVLMVGGAMAFHRLFPEESPWFGFFVPMLAIVALSDFIEHLVPLPTLVWLLPIGMAATLWLAFFQKAFKRVLILPTGIFLATFAFTFLIRCIQPNIEVSSDGLSDLKMVSDYLQGQTLPPTDTWLPPYPFQWYYSFHHYAGSVLTRILGTSAGEGYNVAYALLSSLICVAASGAAHRISGGRTWVALLMPFVIESSATGASAYILLTSHQAYPSVWTFEDLSDNIKAPPDQNLLWQALRWDPRSSIDPNDPAILRLQVPGFWTWRSEFHANATGHLLAVLTVLVIAELMYIRRTLWPWVLAVLIPIIAVMASAWALPMTALLCWGIIPIALYCGRRPVETRLAVLVALGGLIILWPGFANATSSPQPPPMMWTQAKERVPLLEFLVQWWPIILLWICAVICWFRRRLPFGLVWIVIVVPITLVGIEFISIESRYNTIEKMWGYAWGAALVGLLPFIAVQRGVVYRVVLIILLLSSAITLYGWVRDIQGRTGWLVAGLFHMEGDAYLQQDDQKRKILQALKQTHHQTYLAGKCEYCYNEAPAPVVFSGNRSYVAWSWYEQMVNFRDQVEYREKVNNDFYSGTLSNRARFLHDNKINGVLVWPGDHISDDVLTGLHSDLDADYQYIDCKGNGPDNAGVFLRRE